MPGLGAKMPVPMPGCLAKMPMPGLGAAGDWGPKFYFACK